ncbi:hypothetical protein DB42_EU00450 [Neochlamydia sp. EPS4]|nr:hypothetical protein DB42_EU00450 [Neochlamydia sp. EPS4]
MTLPLLPLVINKELQEIRFLKGELKEEKPLQDDFQSLKHRLIINGKGQILTFSAQLYEHFQCFYGRHFVKKPDGKAV